MYKSSITEKEKNEILKVANDLDFKGDTESFITGYVSAKISIPMDAEVKPATAEEIIKILNKAAEEINIGQSTTYDGFDITKDRKNFIAKIRKHIRKQLSV